MEAVNLRSVVSNIAENISPGHDTAYSVVLVYQVYVGAGVEWSVWPRSTGWTAGV